MVVAGRAAAEHRHWLVEIVGLRIPRDNAAAAVRLLDQISEVMGIDACPSGRGFIDSSAERIILERYRPAAAWQRHAAEAVLEVPGIGGGVRAGPAGERVAVGVDHY